jgi:hypothetical protein
LNVLLSSDVLEVPLGGSNEFNATINFPPNAPTGIYTGKIVASAITGSDSVDVEVTLSEPPSVEQPEFFKDKSSIQGNVKGLFVASLRSIEIEM